jgi:hypothetical protein
MSDTTRLLRQSGVAKSDDVNRLRAIVQMNIARASAGQVGVRGSHGSVFRQSQGFKTKGYSGTGGVSHPFKLINASTTAPAAKVSVIYGTVNNFVPTIGGTSIFTDPAPTLTVVTGTVYLDATVDGAGAITAVVIANAATTPADTTTRKYKTIGSVTVASNAVTAIAQNVITSLTLYLCNGTAIWE